MNLFNCILIFLLKCICCKGALLLWSNKKLSISALSEFNNNEFEQLMEDLGNPETFIFKNPSRDLQKELKTVIKHYHSAYSPSGDLNFENVTELLGDGPLDVMKIEQTLDDPDRKKNFLSVIIIPNNVPRLKRDVNDDGSDDGQNDNKDDDNDQNQEKPSNPNPPPNSAQDDNLKTKDNDNNKKEKDINQDNEKSKDTNKDNKKLAQPKDDLDKNKKTNDDDDDDDDDNDDTGNKPDTTKQRAKDIKPIKPFVYKKPEGPVMYLKKSTKNDLYTLLYSSKPLLLKLKGGEEILLGNTSEDMITVDSRLNINIPLENGKITLRFSFSKLYGYWSLTSVKITGTEKDLNLNLNATSDITAAIHFSYHCSDKTVFTDAKKENALYLYDMQVQIDARKPRFSDATDCVNFTTVPIWSGLFVTALLGIGLVVALTAMLDIKTMDKFDNQKTKQLTITVFE